jgi:putative ABC transport system permease protein
MTLIDRGALACIRLATPRDQREWVIGDTLEEFALRQRNGGPMAARRWLLSEAVRVSAHRLRRHPRGTDQIDAKGDGMMQTLVQDVRYALRLLRRSPAFTATAFFTLAIAIAANAAIFSAVKGMLIAPLPYPSPDRLVRVFEESDETPHFPMSPADFRDYRATLQTLDGVAAYMRDDLQIGDADQPEQLRGMRATAGFFTVLGWTPILGRDFQADDEIPDRGDVVILSHPLWLRRFAGDPGVIGRSIRLSGRLMRVVGVLPQGFRHVGGTYRTYAHGEQVDVWWPLHVPQDEQPRDRFSHYFNVIARMKPATTWAAMEHDLRTTGIGVAKRYPSPPSPWRTRAVPLKHEIVGSVESTLVVLSGAAAVMLLLACVNVGGLLLGRAAARVREIGVRAALGATRGRLARQLLIESVVLAAGGGIIGLGIAYGAVAALVRFGPADLPRLAMVAVDGQVVAYSLAATLASALIFGLAPAIRLATAGVGATLKDGGRTVAGGSHQRLRRVFAAVQMALAFVLVVASALLLRSFAAIVDENPGFEPSGAVTALVQAPPERYPAKALGQFYLRAAEQIRQLPGVRAAGFGSDLPWTGYDENTGFGIVGRTFARGEGPGARYHFITAGYARATGVPVVAGRELTFADTDESPRVVLINQSTARKYWSSAADAVGARVDVWGAARTVVGVIGDVKDMPWSKGAEPAIYLPIAQVGSSGGMLLVVRSDLPPASLVDSVRRVIRTMDPELPIARVRPLADVASSAIATRRLTLWLVGCFGFSALLLAVVGIYGVMAQAVGQRTHEFGVRQALGATAGEIMRLVFSSGAAMAVAGLLAGVILALLSTRLLASLLYGVSALDPATFAGVAGVLAIAAAAASYLPARHATRISAATALRSVE